MKKSMVHELNITVKQEEFTTKYLQIFNGIWKLNKIEFSIMEYIMNNSLIVTKSSADVIAEDLDRNVATIRLSIRDLIRRKVLVVTVEDQYVINPVLYSGAKKVVINFNVVSHEL